MIRERPAMLRLVAPTERWRSRGVVYQGDRSPPPKVRRNGYMLDSDFKRYRN
jgi:hypothetical protein